MYSYDPLYRLKNASYTGGMTATYNYVYDSVGNMTAYTETVGTNSTGVSRTFNAANQLVTATDAANGTTSYYYDANGNLTRILPPGVNAGDAGEQVYSYNQRNLLLTMTTGAGGGVYNSNAAYAYDGDGNRVQQTDYSSPQPVTTTYHNDNTSLSQVLIAETHSASSGQAGAAQTANLYGLDLILQDDNSQTRFLLTDGLGSVRQEIANDAVQTATTYEPYGNILAQTGTSGTTYAFTGEQFDAAAGLLYLRARYYNPNLHLFMGRDPWRGSLIQPGTQHAYSYGGNNPVIYVDPSGNCIVGWSGEVRMSQYPYGTSGLCPHTQSEDAEVRYILNCPYGSIAKCIYNRSTSYSAPTGTYTPSLPWNDISNGLYVTDEVLDILDVAKEIDDAIPVPGFTGPSVVALAEMSRNKTRNESFSTETAYVVEAVVKDVVVGAFATRAAGACFVAFGETGVPAFVAGMGCGVSVAKLGGEVSERIQIIDLIVTMNNTPRDMCPRIPEWSAAFYPPHPYYYAGSCESIECFPNRSQPQGPSVSHP